jgi:hypothetical protein
MAKPSLDVVVLEEPELLGPRHPSRRLLAKRVAVMQDHAMAQSTLLVVTFV